MTTRDKSVVRKTEEIFDDFLDLWCRRRMLCIVVCVVVSAPSIFGLIQQLVVIPSLKRETASVTADLATARRHVDQRAARIQELEIELTPFRTLAIEKFNKADSETLKTLAATMASLQHDYTESLTKIASLQIQIVTLHAKTLPRSLTADQRTKIVQGLRTAPKGTVSVTADYADTEANDYARQIEKLLTEAGFSISAYVHGAIGDDDKGLGLGGGLLMTLGIPGVSINFADDPHQLQCAGALQQVFKQAGLELVGRKAPTKKVVIWVGQKP